MQKVLAASLLSLMTSACGMAELGKSLIDLKILKNLTVVRETTLYNRTFTLAVAEDKAAAGKQAQYLFLSNECLQIRYFSGTQPWTEGLAMQIWKSEFGDLPIKKTVQDNFTIFDGANGEEMVMGKGKYAPALLIQSPRMTRIRNLWLEGQPPEFQMQRENDLDFSLWGFGPGPADDTKK